MGVKKNIAGVAVAAALLLTGCGGESGSAGNSTEPLKVGASIQLSGMWSQPGKFMQMGLEIAIEDINAEGGIQVGDTMRPVELVIVDNRSDIPTYTDQVRDLILNEEVNVLIAPCVTEFSMAGAAVAEQYEVPYMVACTPAGAFKAANPEGWEFAWDMFYSEQEQAENLTEALDTVDTNKKVALFTDTTSDGVGQREAFVQALGDAGFDVVVDATYPMGTTDYSSMIQQAKEAEAEISIGVAVPPDGFALLKGFLAQGYAPKVSAFPKAADGSIWLGLGPDGMGTLGQSAWPAATHNDTAKVLLEKLESNEVPHPDVQVPANYYAVMEVVADAVSRAGSTERKAINDAVADTDLESVMGPIQYDENHVATIPMFVFQWQEDQPVQVFPEVGNTWQVPNPALQN